MIVNDLFNKVTFEDLWKYFYENLIKEDNYDLEKEAKSKISHKEAFEKIKKLIPKKNEDSILIAYKAIDTFDENEPSYECVDISLFDKKEIKEKFNIYDKFENDFDFSILSKHEIINCLHESRNEITSYAFEFSSWQEVLGYEICEESLNDIGYIPFLSAVFYEMTFCGFDEEDIQEELNVIIERKEEVEKAIEENNTGKFVSLNEVFPDWNKYTPSEESIKISYLNSIENWKRLYKYIKNI